MRRQRLRRLLAAAALLLALVGPATAQEQPGPPPEAPERPIPARGVSDEVLEERLRGIFSELEETRPFSVEVGHGIVHLRGQTESARAREEAERLARRLEGVVWVDNGIRLDERIGVRLAPVSRKLRGLVRSGWELVPALLAALLVFLVFWGMGRLVRGWRRPFEWLGLSELSSRFVRLALQAVCVLGGLLLALDVLDVMAVAGVVVGGLGLLGLVLGLAFRDVVSNYLPGVLLGLHPPFEVGNLVRIGPHEGRIARVNPRETVLLALDGTQLRVPNHEVYDSTIVNLTTHPQRRLSFAVPVAVSTDLRRLAQVGLRALAGVRGVLAEPKPFMRTRAVLENQIEVSFFAWVDQRRNEFLNVEHRARRAVVEALLAEGIELPTPVIGVRTLEPLSPERRQPPPPDDDEGVEARSTHLLDAVLAEEAVRPDEPNLLDLGRRREAPAPTDDRNGLRP